MILDFSICGHLRKSSNPQTPAKPSPNLDDTGPIVRRPTGLPITAGCDTALGRTRVFSDTSNTEMQCLRPLRHSGVGSRGERNILAIFTSNYYERNCGQWPKMLCFGK